MNDRKNSKVENIYESDKVFIWCQTLWFCPSFLNSLFFFLLLRLAFTMWRTERTLFSAIFSCRNDGNDDLDWGEKKFYSKRLRRSFIIHICNGNGYGHKAIEWRTSNEITGQYIWTDDVDDDWSNVKTKCFWHRKSERLNELWTFADWQSLNFDFIFILLYLVNDLVCHGIWINAVVINTYWWNEIIPAVKHWSSICIQWPSNRSLVTHFMKPIRFFRRQKWNGTYHIDFIRIRL